MQHAMLMRILIAASLAGIAFLPAADARRVREQDQAFAARKAGQIMPLHEIESRIIPKMPGCDYLGPDFDPGSGVYRLKFMRGGSVIYIDVDGHSGQIVGRSGN